MIFSSPRSVASSTSGSSISAPAKAGSVPSGRRAPRAASGPRGSNVSAGSGTDPFRAASRAIDQPVDASLGGELAPLLEPLVPARVARDEQKREIETAGVHDREQVVDARRDLPLLPAGDHRAFAVGQLGQLGLGQLGAQPRLADQGASGSRHENNYTHLVHKTCKRTATLISYTCSERGKRSPALQ